MRLMIAAIALASATTCVGSTVFLGPTPYLSEADSPFDLSGLGSTFYLEDFEDGELNTPGISQPPPAALDATVLPPGPTTDSVDGDDGAIDGSGTSGHALAAGAATVQLSDPPHTFWFINFDFDQQQLGFLPNKFGFVWTDGLQGSRVTIELFDEDMNIFATHEYSESFGDEVFTGTTPEDRFLGVVSDQGIFRVRITSRHIGGSPPLEIDHVQYGHAPEPSTMAMISLALLTLSGFVHRSSRRQPA